MNNADEAPIRDVESELRELSSGRGLPETSLWKAALNAAQSPAKSTKSNGPADQSPLARSLALVRPFRGLAASLVLISIVALLISQFLPSLSRARRSSQIGGDVAYSMRSQGRTSPSRDLAGDADYSKRVAPMMASESPAGRGEFGFTESGIEYPAGQSEREAASHFPTAVRSVIRKSTVELLADDVRSAFFKINMLINEGQGEFIADASITGEQEEHPRAEVTLRVAATRLSEVLNEIRQLGRVPQEKIAAEDVSDQLVDLGARLRNEERVEEELLELLQVRDDAPLKEVLDVRNELGRVREQIERLRAQQSQLNSLVALSTVLIIIRHDGATEPEEESAGVGAYFGRVLGNAWESSILALADSIAWIVYIAIGGLLWWLIAGAAMISALIAYRRRQQATPNPDGSGSGENS